MRKETLRLQHSSANEKSVPAEGSMLLAAKWPGHHAPAILWIRLQSDRFGSLASKAVGNYFSSTVTTFLPSILRPSTLLNFVDASLMLMPLSPDSMISMNASVLSMSLSNWMSR